MDLLRAQDQRNTVYSVKDGTTQVISIRTTRDRWIAFHPREGGKKWKTLDDAQLVIVSAVDSKEEPKNIQVYVFPAKDVRKHFDDAYKARAADGHRQRDDFGMWIALDTDQRGIASSVGSGLAAKYKPVATYSIGDLAAAVPPKGEVREGDDEAEELALRPTTIAEVMAWARSRVAELAGVRVDAVKLDLRVEY